MNISGKTMIFVGKYGYETTISNKKEDETYDNMYVAVTLPKDTKLENQTLINITKGFITFFKTKEGLPKIKFVVQEFNFGYSEENEDIRDDAIVYGDELPF